MEKNITEKNSMFQMPFLLKDKWCYIYMHIQLNVDATPDKSLLLRCTYKTHGNTTDTGPSKYFW